MGLNEEIQGISSEMMASPMREAIKDNKVGPWKLSGKSNEDFMGLLDQVRILQEQFREPLKIVLMGVVKSGKSTLLNALIGEVISPVDILEATAVIMEVAYGEQEKACIYFRDGTQKEYSIKQAHAYLKQYQSDKFFSSNIKNVQIFKSSEKFKNYNLVDTPGLASVTEANMKTTHDYIQRSDVILWVLNGEDLGDLDIMEQMQKVNSYGKPMACIISHIDEIDDKDKPRTIEFVKEREFSVYFKKIFTVAGKEAFKCAMSKDIEGINESGLGSILSYLKEIGQAKQEVKEASVRSSLGFILKKDLKYHNLVLFDIDSQRREVETVKNDLVYHEDIINKKTTDWIIAKIRDEYFEAEFKDIKGKTDSHQGISNEYLNEVFSAQSIQSITEKFIEGFKKGVEDYLLQEWEGAVSVMEDKIGKYLKEYYQKRRELFEEDLGISVNESVSGKVLTEGFDASKIATWLVSSNWSMPALMALGWFHPFIAMGIELWAQFTHNKKGGENLLAEIRKEIDIWKLRFIQECTEKKFMQPIYSKNSEICKEILNRYKNAKFYGWDESDLFSFEKEMKQYIHELEIRCGLLGERK